MSTLALITGASSGIGKEFARYHASLGGDVILTARREDELNELKKELESKHGIHAHVFAFDLGSDTGADTLYDAVKDAGLNVEILINNAGFGGFGLHIERDIDVEMSMIDLNIKSLVKLAHKYGTDMIAQGGGRILNVGSTAGFVPGPNQAVYFATKAFVASFSQALDQELRSKGVTCTVLAPGYVETEFATVGNLHGTQMVKAGGATAASVAKIGYDAMQRGKLVVINQKSLSFVLNWVVPFFPRRFVLKMIQKNQSK